MRSLPKTPDILKTLSAAALLAATLFCGAGALAQDMPSLPSIADEQARLQSQLKDIETQISADQQQLAKLGSQKKTLANEVAQLKIRNATIELQARQTKLLADSIGNAIAETQQTIDRNRAKIERFKIYDATLVREIRDQDRFSIVELLASSENLSDFFGRAYRLIKLHVSLGKAADDIRKSNDAIAVQQLQLLNQRERQERLATILALQNADIVRNISTQNTLLARTKGSETAYQQSLADSKKVAAQIRNQIYSLLQVGRQVTFAEAAQVAAWASGQTGVRPAFLLAIITQESNLGRNVGTCNRVGDPPSKSWRVVMKPERDQKPFLAITAALGKDPDTTPVSCPMHDKAGNQVGWGGAMGPAQFIPSTWMGYAGKVAAITGKTADPWDIRDAFLASAIKLRADGAGSQDGEWTAAMRYFSGSTDLAYRFYGDNVVATAAKYQDDLDTINK